MKKLFTPDNYLTGFITSATMVALYFLFTTTNSWKYVLGLASMFVTFTVIGYVVNTMIKKYGK